MKKLLCLLLTALLTFGLVACKEQPQNGENTGTSEESSSTVNNSDTGSTDTSDTTESSQNQQEEIPATKIVYLCTEETISYTTEKGGSKTTRTYDEKGNLLTEFYKSNDGLAGYGSAFTYDEKGNKLTYKAYDNSGKVVGTEEYTYNEAGQLISQKSRNDDSYPVDSAYTYNENGLLIKKVNTYPENPESAFWFVYSYDSKGNLVKEEWINIQGDEKSPHSHIDFTYDANGNKLSEIHSNGIKTEWTYDDRGNMLSESQYDSDGFAMLSTIYTYDAQNRLLTETWCKGGVVGGGETYEYAYNSAGLRTCRYRYMSGESKDGLTPDMEYTYDGFGNLLSEASSGRLKEYKYIAIELPNQQKES